MNPVNLTPILSPLCEATESRCTSLIVDSHPWHGTRTMPSGAITAGVQAVVRGRRVPADQRSPEPSARAAFRAVSTGVTRIRSLKEISDAYVAAPSCLTTSQSVSTIKGRSWSSLTLKAESGEGAVNKGIGCVGGDSWVGCTQLVTNNCSKGPPIPVVAHCQWQFFSDGAATKYLATGESVTIIDACKDSCAIANAN